MYGSACDAQGTKGDAIDASGPFVRTGGDGIDGNVGTVGENDGRKKSSKRSEDRVSHA